MSSRAEHEAISIVIVVGEELTGVSLHVEEAAQVLGHLVKDSKLLDQVLSELLFRVPLTAVVLTEVLHCDVTLTADVKISLYILF